MKEIYLLFIINSLINYNYKYINYKYVKIINFLFLLPLDSSFLLRYS